MKNSKLNKALYTAILCYIIMATDILVNSYVALKWFSGVPQIYPSFNFGFLVLNPISVSISFIIGTLFLMIGLQIKRRAN